MKILLLNQAFYPDVVSSGQHLTDLALALAARGDEVTVVTSSRGYDDPRVRFRRRERWRGISIIRIPSLALGKSARWRRAVDFGSYLIALSFTLLLQPRYDVIVAMTSPPLVAAVGALFARTRGGRFVFWILDLNPDEAIAAGWLRPTSLAAYGLRGLLRFSLSCANRVVVLDRFMADVVRAYDVPTSKISTIAPWSHDDVVKFDRDARERFRSANDLSDQFVVMYAGNHSPCHPLETIIEAAARMAGEADVTFCFVGGGSEFRRLRAHGAARELTRVRCIPYQPREALAGLLSAADLHLVVMGDPFVGFVHPCKIYNILLVGAPVLYVGPENSHIADLLRDHAGVPSRTVAHGDVNGVVAAIRDARRRSTAQAGRAAEPRPFAFVRSALVPQMLRCIDAQPCLDPGSQPMYPHAENP